jgi:hypothetical protein
MSFDALLHPYIQCESPSSVLDINCCSPSHHLIPTSTDRASYSPLSMVKLCLVDSMAPEFGLVVDLTQNLGSPLSDAQIQLIQRARRTSWHCWLST